MSIPYAGGNLLKKTHFRFMMVTSISIFHVVIYATGELTNHANACILYDYCKLVRWRDGSPMVGRELQQNYRAGRSVSEEHDGDHSANSMVDLNIPSDDDESSWLSKESNQEHLEDKCYVIKACTGSKYN